MSSGDQRSGRARGRWYGWIGAPPASRWLRGLGVVLGIVLGLGLWLHEPPPPSPGPAAEPTPRRTAVRVWPRSEQQRAALLARARDVWSEHAGAALDLVLDPDAVAMLRARSIPFTVLVPDVDAVAAAERERLAAVRVARPPEPGRWFSEYRDLDSIHAYLQQLARLRPDLAQTRDLGRSLEGRSLLALRIGGPGPASRRMLVNGGLHAREWISMMVATCVADRLLRGYDQDPRLRRLVDEVELWVLPVANPDGYVHSWRHDRYWRKNRRGDHGVDLNRNFPLAWGGPGSSDQPASQIYRGAAPLSEPESAAIGRLLQAERFDAHIDLHSYGQLLLHPWSHTRQRAPEHPRLHRLAGSMATAIEAVHGERYRLISGSSLYPASGTLLDWAHGSHGIDSFVIELRPRGGTGFVLPPDQIDPTCDEGLAAVLSLHESSRAELEQP